MSWLSAKLSVSGSTITLDGSTVANVEWGLLGIDGIAGVTSAVETFTRDAANGLAVPEVRDAGRTITVTANARSRTAGALHTALDKWETVIAPSTGGTTIQVTVDGTARTWVGWLVGAPRFAASGQTRTFTVEATFAVANGSTA